MDIKEFFDRQTWTTSKTYAQKAPHQYIVRANVNGTNDEFNRAVAYIRHHGFEAMFWNSKYTYLYLDGYFYWTMGAPIEETIVLNRCKASGCEVQIRVKRADDL